MNTFLEVVSTSIDKLHEILIVLVRYINADNYENVYKIIFELFYRAVYNKPFLLKNLHKDVRLFNVLQYTKKLMDYISNVAYRHCADLHIIAQEIFRRAYAFLEEIPKSSPRYVIFCDGISIIDTTYIAYRLKKEHMEPFIALLINPGGVTETYKFIFEPHSYLQGTNITLNDIAHKIARSISARDTIVFRDYDEAIHQLRDVHSTDIIDKMYGLTSRLYNKIIQLKNEFNGTVLLLSDHGYDIIEKNMNLYEVKHFWRPHSLSIVASLLII